jgi:uncharacterized protein DUF3795
MAFGDMMTEKKDFHPDKKLTAVCGLFCPACTLFIGTAEDEPKRLKTVADVYHTAPEVWECNGCRSEKRSYFCKNECKMVDCAKEKGIDFCVECDEYPCVELREFKEKRPHRIELWEAQERIKKKGYAKWYEEMHAHYGCPRCGIINSAYDLKCRKCGEEPSCAYVNRHKDEILSYLSGRK